MIINERTNYLNLMNALERRAESQMTDLQKKSYLLVADRHGYPLATQAILFYLTAQKAGHEFPLAKELERRIHKEKPLEL